MFLSLSRSLFFSFAFIWAVQAGYEKTNKNQMLPLHVRMQKYKYKSTGAPIQTTWNYTNCSGCQCCWQVGISPGNLTQNKAKPAFPPSPLPVLHYLPESMLSRAEPRDKSEFKAIWHCCFGGIITIITISISISYSCFSSYFSTLLIVLSVRHCLNHPSVAPS